MSRSRPARADGAAPPDPFHPFEPPFGDWLTLPTAEWAARASALAAERDIRSGGGAPIRFDLAVPRATGGRAPATALDYERAVHRDGRVGCRGDGHGAVHDLCNALVWLALPRTKAALNDWHVRHADAGPRPSGAGRGRARDLATLIDESGLLWLSAAPACDDALRERRWQALFVAQRARIVESVRPIVIGHGLLQKLARPYKAMTAHALLLRATLPSGAATVASTLAATLALADRLAAERLRSAAGGGEPLACVPIPVMGLPGWCRQNADPAFFDDTRVFRPSTRPAPRGTPDPSASNGD